MLGSYLGPGVCIGYCLLSFKCILYLNKRLGDVLVLYLIGQAGMDSLEDREEGLDFRDFACLVGG